MKVIGFGEVMMRLSTPLDTQLERTEKLNIYFGGAEYNTLVNLAGLGHEVELVTSLPNNQLSRRIVCEAKAYGVETNNVKYNEGRLGTYYTISGNDSIPTSVIYDRANSTFANSRVEDYDFESILEGADLFHVSGITPALSEELMEITLHAIKCAKKLGIKVSYDSNYRSKLWSQQEAGEFLKQVLPLIDYAFLGILDINYLLNICVSELEVGYSILKESYPNIKFFASTNRTVINNNQHKLQANIYDKCLYQTKEHEFYVKDRIGGGDAFTAGIIDGVLNKKCKEEIAQFALFDTIIKHGVYGDNCFINRQDVELAINSSDLDVQR